MLSLLINSATVDLYENESVNLVKQFTDVQNIQSPVSSFTQTFRVPATKRNLAAFGLVTIPDASSVDLKQKFEAELQRDTMPILRGGVQVKGVYMQKEHYADIELVFFGEAVDLKTAIGDALLPDLDLSALNHDLTYAAVTGSWTANLFSGKVRYGLIDRGNNWSFVSQTSSLQYPWTSTDGIFTGELTPYVMAREILNAILDEAGFTYESNFINDGDPSAAGDGAFHDLYIPAFRGTTNLASTDAQQNRARAALEQDYGNSTWGTLDVVDDCTGGIDEANKWDNTTNKYTSPLNGFFDVRVTYSWDQGSHTDHVGLRLKVVRTSGTEYIYIVDHGDDTFSVANNKLFETVVFLEDGDTVELQGRVEAGQSHVIKGNDNATSGVRTVVDIEAAEVLSGQEIDIAANMPKVKQIDYLTALQRMFNLVFIPDPDKPNHLKIEPFTDYMSSGTVKDWSTKVDYSMDFVMRPTSDIQSKEYSWSYAPGGDFISQELQRSQDRVYGRYRILDGENPFATGKTEIQVPAAPYIVSHIPGSFFPIHRAINSDGSIVSDPKLMFCYWHGTVLDLGTWYLRNDTFDEVALTLFPSFSQYSAAVADLTDKDLNFGVEAAFVPQTCNPRDTLYILYWAQYVTELYSTEARIVECHAYLTNSDVRDFAFNDKIHIKGVAYRVLKIEYDANVDGTSKLTLIKILSDVSLCADEPTSLVTRGNYILFNSTTPASPDYGSQACCEFYGYNWVPNSIVIGGVTPLNLCKPLTIQSQPES